MLVPLLSAFGWPCVESFHLTCRVMGDINNPCGWSTLTGQELWVPSSVFPFVVAPICTDRVRFVLSMALSVEMFDTDVVM